MADNTVMIASAVVVPEAAQESVAASGATKRRQSSPSRSESQGKRPRLDVDHEVQQVAQPVSSAAQSMTPETPVNLEPHQNNDASRRRSRAGIDQGKDEERKRGKRLFGALLGTLSNTNSSSSSTTQKRRADIDRKQQEKLKLQAEEYDEQLKKRLDELSAVRRKEQVIWDEESLHLKHANMLAMAHFLKTNTEPVLYFKPWELSARDKERLDAQIEEAEREIEEELEQQRKMKPERLPARLEKSQIDGVVDTKDVDKSQALQSDAGQDEPPADAEVAPTNELTPNSIATTNAHDKLPQLADDETTKNIVEDNEEVVVEAGEDAVLW